MSRRRPSLQTRLMSAIGVMYAEVRTREVVTTAERAAQRDLEDTLQLLLSSPLTVARLAELAEEVG